MRDILNYIKNHRADFAAGALLLLLAGLLHYRALSSYWLFDDLQILKQAHDHRPWEYFFIPGVWHEVSVSNFTPLLTLSFDVDYSLFGFRPAFFYLHHILAVWLAAVMLYAVLRLWIPRSYAFCGSLLFSVSAPVIFSGEFLCLRHYVEGSVLILASLLFFVNALRKNSLRLACLSAVAYLMAMLAKEVYIPFVLVIFFLPEKKWSSRFRLAVPHLAAFFTYVVWRSHMLGRTIGGYESKFFQNDMLSEIRRIVFVNGSESLKMLSGNSPISGPVDIIVIATTVLLLLAAFLVRARKGKFAGIIFAAVLVASVYAPISPHFLSVSAAVFETYRFVFHVTLCYASLIAVVAYELSQTKKMPRPGTGRHGMGMLLLLVIVASLVSVSSYQWFNKQRADVVVPLTAEGRFLMESDADNIMVKSNMLSMAAYYEIMDYFRMLYEGQRIPYVVHDVFFGVGDDSVSGLNGRRVFKFGGAGKGMIDVTQEFIAKRKTYFSRVRKMPLEVRFGIKRGAVGFSLGPSDAGHYFLLIGYRPGVYNTFIGPLGRSWPSKVFVGKMKWYIRFGWESPEGWITFSPEWFVDFSQDREIVWRR